jgi:hypothetical protein
MDHSNDNETPNTMSNTTMRVSTVHNCDEPISNEDFTSLTSTHNPLSHEQDILSIKDSIKDLNNKDKIYMNYLT